MSKDVVDVRARACDVCIVLLAVLAMVGYFGMAVWLLCGDCSDAGQFQNGFTTLRPLLP